MAHRGTGETTRHLGTTKINAFTPMPAGWTTRAVRAHSCILQQGRKEGYLLAWIDFIAAAVPPVVRLLQAYYRRMEGVPPPGSVMPHNWNYSRHPDADIDISHFSGTERPSNALRRILLLLAQGMRAPSGQRLQWEVARQDVDASTRACGQSAEAVNQRRSRFHAAAAPYFARGSSIFLPAANKQHVWYSWPRSMQLARRLRCAAARLAMSGDGGRRWPYVVIFSGARRACWRHAAAEAPHPAAARNAVNGASHPQSFPRQPG